MERYIFNSLDHWSRREHRKPLIVRGARQVGKTTLVRLFATQRFENLAEINFERNPELIELFATRNPRQALEFLELHLGTEITPGRSLLFLDEIQAAPEVFAALRYFFEELPDLHVIAAGSLLDLVLENQTFSVPVGRLEYLHLGPMQFEEFLLAAGEKKLVEFLGRWTPAQTIPQATHRQFMGWLERFLIVGGMPEAVKAFVDTGAFQESEIVKHSILSTFRDDFGKYGRRINTERLRKVFGRLPRLVGQKLKYIHIDREERSRDLAAALHLLTLARVAAKVHRSAANGVPLGAEASDRHFKILFLDTGLVSTATGLTLLDLERADDVLAVNRGALCEQFIGQHLLYSSPSWEEPRLHYWAREKRSSNAEVDYVISQGQEIIPVEVKAGKTGTLKSLHLFMQEKRRALGVRFNSEPPSLLEATRPLPDGGVTPHRLLSLPLYLVGQARRIIPPAATIAP